MKKLSTPIEGAWVLQPRILTDQRGFFFEAWNRETFQSLGLAVDFAQENHSFSQRGVLRGLHYQAGAAAQGKLVWVTSGRVFDVIVDLRRKSPSFGKAHCHYLDAELHERLWVPPGCAHGFLVCADGADFHYKVTTPYQPETERTLRWNDPALEIPWPIDSTFHPIVSEKDALGTSFEECEKYE